MEKDLNESKISRCEMHCHTHFSICASLDYNKIVEACKKRNISVIAITDHNTIKGAVEFSKMAPDWLKVIISEEIKTKDGEVIGLFLNSEIPMDLSLRDTLIAIKKQNGLTCIPHPFDGIKKNSININELEKNLDLVDMIEVYNSRAIFPSANHKALIFASSHGIDVTCGSDAHTYYEIGKSVLKIKEFKDANDFKKNIHSAIIEGSKSSVLVHLASFINKRKKRNQK